MMGLNSREKGGSFQDQMVQCDWLNQAFTFIIAILYLFPNITGIEEKVLPNAVHNGCSYMGGTFVYPWPIHVNVWQKPPQYCKVIF